MGHAATRILRLFGKGLGSLVAGGLALALGGCGGIEFQGKVFDYLEYFQQNKVFADAFEHYEHLMDVDRYKIYRKKKVKGRPNAP